MSERVSDWISETIRQVLRAKPAAPQPGEGHAASRCALRTHVTICPLADVPSDGRPEKVWMRDLSPMGLGFHHRKPMNAGTQFLVRVPDLDDLSLRCVVVHCERMARDEFVIGASFVPEVSSPEEAAAQTPGESSTSPRQTAPSHSATLVRFAAHAASRGSPAATTPSAAAALVARVRGAAAHSTTPTALIALDRRIVWTNDAFPRLLGLGAVSELVGIPFNMLLKNPNAPGGPPMSQQAERIRTAYVRQDGTLAHVDQTVSTLRDVTGKAVFFFAVAEPVATVTAKLRAVAPAAPPIKPRTSGIPPRLAAEIERIRRAMFS